MVLSLNFNHLYYFYIVGQAGGLSEAAKLLRISQPSLSSQMKILETRLGVTLFKKTGRRRVLTADGQHVFALCQKMFAVAENLDRELTAEGTDRKTHIRFGVSTDIERPFAVDVVSRAFGKDRGTRVRLLSGDETSLQKDLRFGNFDFVLSTTPLFSEGIRVLAECELPVVAGINKKSLRPNSKPKSLHDLPNRWVAPASSQKLRKEAEAYFEKKRLSPSITFESDVMGALIRAIADGLGWGLFPKAYLRHESLGRQILLLGPAEGLWKHHLYLLAPAKAHVPPASERLLIEALRSECKA